jgi:hypothetical protein
VFDIMGEHSVDVFSDPLAAGFGLDMDEVYLTDLQTAPVATHYMRPGT